MAIKAILSDFGAVLVRYDPIADVITRIAKQFGGDAEAARAWYTKNWLSVENGSLRHLDLWLGVCSAAGLPIRELPIDRFSALYVRHLQPIPETIRILKELQQQYPLIGVSNGDFGSLHIGDMLQAEHGLTFSRVYVSSSERLRKPELLGKVASDLKRDYGISPEECVFIDDVPAYTQSARDNYGMHAVTFNGMSDSPEFWRLRAQLLELGVQFS